MNTLFTLLSIVALLLVAAAFYNAALRHAGTEYLANGALVNITPKGRATMLGDVQFPQRYLLAKAGSDTSHIALAGIGDRPQGVVTDQTPSTDASGDLSYPLPVNLFGLNEDTERVIASAAISAGDLVVPYTGGLAQTLPIHGGLTHWVCGQARTVATANGDQVEIIPCFPYQVTSPA